jgi:hypothetical protein
VMKPLAFLTAHRSWTRATGLAFIPCSHNERGSLHKNNLEKYLLYLPNNTPHRVIFFPAGAFAPGRYVAGPLQDPEALSPEG